MYAAVEMRYLAPTNNRGARISARYAGKRIEVPWDYALDAQENFHYAAAIATERFQIPDPLIGGVTNSGYVFVRVPRRVNP